MIELKREKCLSVLPYVYQVQQELAVIAKNAVITKNAVIHYSIISGLHEKAMEK